METATPDRSGCDRDGPAAGNEIVEHLLAHAGHARHQGQGLVPHPLIGIGAQRLVQPLPVLLKIGPAIHECRGQLAVELRGENVGARRT